MYIRGIGLIFAGGRGIERFAGALSEPWHGPGGAFRVDMGGISGGRKLRRADRLGKMAVLAAADAIENSGIEGARTGRVGVIVATALGPHVTTFRFLDDIIEHGEGSVSPTTFSNSVHNAAASYISEALDIQGPTLSVTQFFHSFEYALQLALLWLNEKRCDHVLVGAADEYGDVLGYVCDTKLTSAPDGRIRPFDLHPTCQSPGEGAVFFLIGDRPGEKAFCKVRGVYLGREAHEGRDLNIISTDGLLPDESAYAACLSPSIPTAAYSPIFGSMMVGSAFNCAAGALMLRDRIVFANPVMDNPHGLRLVERTAPADIEIIACARYNCFNEAMVIDLAKT
jgi:3-oxoacyl-[acyl-carrier-protein] synthase II